MAKAIEECKPVKVYNNFKEDSMVIYRENEKKSGVYLLINLINNHTYVGTAINISNRMKNYSSNSYLNYYRNKNMPITKSLLKYGQANFAVLILEYIEINKVLECETNWILKISPYYNVLKKGYSSLGYKHTNEVKKILSDLRINKKHSKKSIDLIRAKLTGRNNPFYGQIHSEETKNKIIVTKSHHPVYIYNAFKKLLCIYPSVKTLADIINANSITIKNFINTQNLFRGGWYFAATPYQIFELPLIENYSSKEGKDIILDILNNKHIRKALFTFNDKKEFICKYDGVVEASLDLKIKTDQIKNYALHKINYNGLMFSYHRIL